MAARLLLGLTLCLLTPPGLLTLHADAAEPASVTFRSIRPEVGDAVDQQIRTELRIKTLVRRGAEVLKESKANNVRGHTRRVTTTEVSGGRRTGVQVVYSEATDESIAGKTYHCRRHGDALHVTDATGAIPPAKEFEIVTRHMQRLGHPNPLAEFLLGKTVTVGQTIDVPSSVAAELFGSKQFGETDRFQLKLTEVIEDDGATHARFDAQIRVVATDGSQMQMELGGPMVVGVATGQLTSAELLGPIALNHSRHNPQGRVQVSATGRFTVSLRSTSRESLVANQSSGTLLR